MHCLYGRYNLPPPKHKNDVIRKKRLHYDLNIALTLFCYALRLFYSFEYIDRVIRTVSKIKSTIIRTFFTHFLTKKITRITVFYVEYTIMLT